MGTSTLVVLRQKVAEEIGDWRAETCTSAGASGGTTLVSTALADKPDDYYNDWYVVPTSGTYSGVSKKISDFTSTTGTVTVYSAWAGQIANSVTFELHRFNPADYTRALNEARLEAYPNLHRKIIDESLITGNWLNDGGFEDWTSATAIADWEAIGTGTFSKQTAVFLSRLYGSLAAIVAAPAAADGIMQRTVANDRLLDLKGQTVKFRAVVLGTVSDHLLAVVDDSATTSSSALAATNKWETLSVERAIPSTTKSLQFRCTSPAAVTFRIDNARVIGPACYDYKLNSAIEDISNIEIQSGSFDANYACDDLSGNNIWLPIYGWSIRRDGTDKWLHTRYALTSEYKLRLTARGYLSSLSADTDTMEIEGDQVRVLVALAAHKLYEMNSSLVVGQDRKDYQEQAATFYQKYDQRRNQHCLAEPVQLPF